MAFIIPLSVSACGSKNTSNNTSTTKKAETTASTSTEATEVTTTEQAVTTEQATAPEEPVNDLIYESNLFRVYYWGAECVSNGDLWIHLKFESLTDKGVSVEIKDSYKGNAFHIDGMSVGIIDDKVATVSANETKATFFVVDHYSLKNSRLSADSAKEASFALEFVHYYATTVLNQEKIDSTPELKIDLTKRYE